MRAHLDHVDADDRQQWRNPLRGNRSPRNAPDPISPRIGRPCSRGGPITMSPEHVSTSPTSSTRNRCEVMTVPQISRLTISSSRRSPVKAPGVTKKRRPPCPRPTEELAAEAGLVFTVLTPGRQLYRIHSVTT